MPANSKHYQREYRAKTKAARKVVSVSMDRDDHVELSRFASSQGLSLSRLLREASLQQSRLVKMQSPDTAKELKELRLLIANIANNLNQIAHHSNRVKHVVDENSVFTHLASLEKLVLDFVSQK